ncbi:MAG: ABC transporter permease [Deltaproteobacteria bacterium]|nr:MAG: ABC transporter permease [Deltaproteobacteria bacterium]
MAPAHGTWPGGSSRASGTGWSAPGISNGATTMAVEAVGRVPRRPGPVGRLGAGILDILQVLGEAASLFAAAVRASAFAPIDRQRVIVQMVRVGTDTLSIGALLSIFVGMVLVVQAADQLRDVNESVLGPIVGLAMTKELGPVMMAFLLAGRAGSAMAAELGSMTVYDEINALRTMDIDPVRFLVMPRFVAATLALPLLILYSDFIGVWGGAVVVAIDPAIKLTVNEYFARMLEWVHLSDILIGLVKGLVFGMIASILPCTFGLRTRGGTEGIATATTAAVVWSFILILVFDFLIVRGSFAAG